MKEITVPESRVESLLLDEGDILFNEGGDRDKLGRGWVWHKEVDPCVYQNHVFRARLYSKLVIPEFISVFGNTFGQEYFLNRGQQTTNLASINKTKLSAFPVPICTYEEMEIAIRLMDKKVTYIDNTMECVEYQLAKAERTKQSILAKAFSGNLVEILDSDGNASELLTKIREQADLRNNQEKLKRKNRPKVKKEDKLKKKSIIDVLRNTDGSISPEVLFDRTGRNSETLDEVEEFYMELKEALLDPKVEVESVSKKTIRQGDLLSYKVKE